MQLFSFHVNEEKQVLHCLETSVLHCPLKLKMEREVSVRISYGALVSSQ